MTAPFFQIYRMIQISFLLLQISPKDFLAAAETRLKRGNTRKQALIHMKELLTAATKVGGATHLVAAVTSVLQSGPW